MSLTARSWVLALAALPLFVASAAFATAPDLAVTKVGPASANAGTDVTYTIQVTNSGTSAAPNVNVSDAYPAGTSFVSVTPSAGFICTTTGSLSCDATSLAGSTTATFVLVLHIASNASAGTISNTATAAMSVDDPTPGDETATANTNVTTSADLAVTKTGPATTPSGTEITYTITVADNGPSDAASVTMTDTLPAGTTFNTFLQTSGPTFTCSEPAAGAAGTISCSIASLSSGQMATFALDVHVNTVPDKTVISNVANVMSSTSDPDSKNNSSTTSTTAIAPDLAVTKTGPASATVGSNVTYTITLTNSGSDVALTATLLDTVPSHMTFVSESQSSGPAFSCTNPSTGGTGTTNCTNSGLSPGATAVFVVVDFLTTSAAAGSTVTNTAQATTTSPEPNKTNNSGSLTTTVLAPDLAVTKVGPATAVAGTNVTYTITLANSGNADAGTVTLTDSVPANMTFVSESQSSGPAFTCSNPSVGGTGTTTCTIGTLAAGQSAIFVLVDSLSTSAPDGSTISNQAQASTTTPEPDTSNNSSTFNLTVNNSADLAVSKIGPMNAVAGSNVTYTVTVSNGGPVAAQTVVLTDAVPANTTFVSESQSSGPSFLCSTPAAGGTGTISCTLSSFATGASAIFVIVVNTSVSSSSPTITNTATVSSSTADRTPGNNSASFQTTLSGINVDLAIAKSGPTGTVTPNANVTYTITVTNNGPGTAGGVTVTDTLPAAESFVSATPSQGTCSGTTTVTCSLGTLANGGTATITLVARINGGAGAVTNTATVSGTNPDTNLANNTASATVTVTTVNIPAESRPMLLLFIALLAISGMMIVRS